MQPVTDEQFVATLQEKSTREMVGQVLVALGQLVLHLGIQQDLTALSINFHGPAMRLDLATVDATGEHLSEWLLALSCDMRKPGFGERLELPSVGPVQ